MRPTLLTLALAIAASALPNAAATAQTAGAAPLSSGSSTFGSTYSGNSSDLSVSNDRERRNHRRTRGGGGDTFFAYRDYQGDTLWQSNSFNDWWHDRPDRSFPRWVRNNKNCERVWWSGGGWRC